MEEKKNSTKETEKNTNDKLDALLLDEEDDSVETSPAEDKAQFNAFMAEYRSLMSKSLHKEEPKEEIFEEKEEVFKAIPSKKASKKAEKKVEKKKNDNWDEAITLNPEKYVDPGEEDKIMVDSLPEEEGEPDFDLGEVSKDRSDDFQLSINFSGEEQTEESVPEKKEYKYDPDKPRAIDWVFDFVEMFVFVLIAVMVLTSFFFKHSVVEGESMLNTLVEEDHLIISDLFYTPERGDIVVFEDYSTALKKAVVKRVIGLPGETVTVKVNSAGAYEVYINGEYLDEPYAYNDIQDYAPGVGEWIVGEGEVFVLGDNRFNSTDSRDPRVGTIDIDCILGKVLFRFMPFDKFGKVE
ncbi:MAG: signal peptidase I [Clostridia bacterium]|nr:signal peptidase I [Clostridia bacterium]